MAGQLVLVAGFILGCLGQTGQNNPVSENQPQFPARWQPPVASQPQAPSPQSPDLSLPRTGRPTLVRRTTPDRDNPYLKRNPLKKIDPRTIAKNGLTSRSQAIPRASRENIFNVCMGTSNGKCDVVSGDETADAWNGRINTSPETIKGDELYKTFWLSTLPTPYGPQGVFMETPVVTSFDSEIAEASVITGSNWRGITPIPNSEVAQKQPLRFSVQFNCQKAGVAKMMLQGRLLAIYPANDDKKTPRLRKEMVVTFQKECAAPEEDAGEPQSPVQAHVGARSDALPGFMVGTAKDQANIIKDGIPMSSFVADSQNPFILAEDKTLFTIHLTLPDNLKLRPVYATVADETLLRVEITSSQPNEASIVFKCLGAGVIDVSVVFGFEKVPRPTFFNLKKACPVNNDVISEDKARPSGVLITGLSIGTKKGESNVAENGLVLEGYRTSLHSNFTVEDSRRTYKKDTSIVKFHISLEHSETHTIRLKKPQVTELHGEETESVMKPKLEYDVKEMKAFFKTGYLMVTLRFNCFRASTGQVLVTFPTSKGTLEVVVQKACSADSSKAVDLPEVVIPGFSVGMSADTPNVVQDGNPVNSFNWAQAGQLAFLGSIYRFAESEAYATFFIGVGPTDGEDEDADFATVNFTSPELIISSDIAEAELTGPASDGALLDEDHKMTRIGVTFHCTGQGAVLMSVVLPMVPYVGSGKVGPAAEKDVKFSFIKVCGNSKVYQQGQGGVGITGFSIGTQSKENDVVYNGFPRESYYGQRNKAVPKWDNVIVGPEKASSALFLSYFTEEEQTLGNEERSIQFGAPMVTVDSSVVRVELSGPASEGAVLVMNDEDDGEIEMDITYECYFQGLAAVTILIPIIPHGVIKATIPKQCEGRSAPVGVRISGFNVGLESGAQDVVNAGFTTSEFQKVNIAMSQGHETNDNMTVFYITNDRPFRATEPLIFAHRPICNPSIEHQLHIKSDNSDQAAGMDGLLFPAGESTLKVAYNCIIGEKTPITLTIPMQSGKVTWTWIQNCGVNDDFDDDDDWDWVDYDAYDELDDDYYYDYYIDVPDDYEDYGDVFEDDYYIYANLDEDCAGCAGTLNVGSEPDGRDIVDRGLALPLYSQVGATSEKTPYKIVDRLTTKSTFYVSIPEALATGGTFQEIFPIVASAGKKKSGKPIALPTVDGPIAIGGTVEEGDTQRFTVSYNCAPDTVGVTSVVIQIPLKPANQGSVVFKVMKMCGKFERVEAFYWTANRILIAVGSALSVCLCLGIFSLIKNLGTVKYAMLPTSEKDVGKGMFRAKQEVAHGIELIEPNPDDSD